MTTPEPFYQDKGHQMDYIVREVRDKLTGELVPDFPQYFCDSVCEAGHKKKFPHQVGPLEFEQKFDAEEDFVPTEFGRICDFCKENLINTDY